MSQKLNFSIPQKAFRGYRFVNSVISKQLLEPKLVNSVRSSHILVASRLLGFHKESISVQPIRTFRSHRVAVTACDSASRCHRVVPLGHTDRVRLYISTGQNLEIFLNLFARALPALPPRVSGSSSSSPATSSRWSPPPSTGFNSAVAAVASPSPH